MNTVPKQEIANAFRNCRRYLRREEDVGLKESSRTSWICSALQISADKGWSTREGVAAAVDIIEERLGDHAFVTTWLHENVPEFKKLVGDPRERQAQAYRHRWVEAMAEEFSK